jgi:hypothetical protein
LSNEPKPRKVIARITRVVTEKAIVFLNRDGTVDEYESCVDEIDYEVTELREITHVFTVHD